MIRVNAISFQRNIPKISFSRNSEKDVLDKAMKELENVELDHSDLDYVKSIGANPPFNSGKEAFDFIKQQNIKVKFEKLHSKNVHAQWDVDKNTIRINEMYKNTHKQAVILAIAEAIFHEAGHAKDFDGQSSIQEEIDCLSLNAMAHNDFKRKYKNVFDNNDEPIIKNGVCLYSEIYFEPDKKRLSRKVKNTYGHLPLGDEKHSSKELAKIIKYRSF